MLFYRHIARRRLAVTGRAHGIGAERVAKLLVEVERDDRLGELVQIAPQYVGRIVDSVACPVETLAIAIGRVEYGLQVFDPLCGSAQSKNALDVGC